ncbi:MAG: 16S rRNA (guanine(527)-N(7))-methyltransferase RsmG [Desulfosarcina sp.]|nr:16S rRNA (guanine(527)-N(7))-methyltransferase RsmG [Desulfobacterales bacterium]
MCEMRHWNRRINLTAITNPEDIAIKHFLDAIAPIAAIPEEARIVDIGSGAGFPGLPIKVVRSLSHLTLVDSSRKKTNFLRHVIRQLKLDQVHTVQVRIEDFVCDPPVGEHFDIIVSRAFTDVTALTRMVMPLLKKGGKLMMWKGPHIEKEIRALNALQEILPDALVVKIHQYRLPIINVGRNLISVNLQGSVTN